LHEDQIKGNELMLKAQEGWESMKQIRRHLHKTSKKDLESDLDMLDMPQPWKHICMANILIQNVLKKKKNTTNRRGPLEP